MPTLNELQRQQTQSKPQTTLHFGEEMVADCRASLSPKQVVDRKLAAHQVSDYSRTAAVRPRAK